MFSFSPDHINSPVAFTRKNANFSSGKSSSPVKSDYVMEGEVSPPKIFLKNIKDHSQLKNKKQEIARQKYELLISKISFLDTELPDDLRKYKYNFDGMLPYVFFFKYLARKPEFDNGSKIHRLKLWVPDSIVINERNDLPPMWFYTSEDGYVYRTDTFTMRNVTSKLGSFCAPDELVAVIKKPSFKTNQELVGNETKLLSRRELGVMTNNALSSRGEINVVQRFIKSNGPKAYICRTVWRRNKNAYSWIITNKKDFFSEDDNNNRKFLVNPRLMHSCNIVYTCGGKQVFETAAYLKNIDEFLNYHLGVQFDEIIGDFIKDEAGIWWFINLKGFVLRNDILIDGRPITNYGEENSDVVGRKKETCREKYKKVKICRYCEILYPADTLTQKMTLKMIVDTDKHLLERGKKFDWLQRYQGKQLESVTFYEEHKVCNSCYKLYKEIENLLQVKSKFANKLGIQKIPEDLQLKNTSSNWETTIQSKTNYIILNDSKPVIKSLNRYRFLLIIHALQELPLDMNLTKSYFLEFTIFDQKIKYKLELDDLRKNKKYLILPVNKIKLFYFFCDGRKNLTEFLENQKFLSIRLICDHKKMGQADYELLDLYNENVLKREYFKFFSGKEILPILNWGLSITIGLFSGKAQCVEDIILTPHRNIFLPPFDYYGYEPLPNEWIASIIENKEIPETKFSIDFQKKQGNNYCQSFFGRDLSLNSTGLKKNDENIKEKENIFKKPKLDVSQLLEFEINSYQKKIRNSREKRYSLHQ